MRVVYSIAVVIGLLFSLTGASRAEEKILKAGLIGCDTSHVIAFTKLINSPDATGAVAKIEVAYAFPGGSDDLPSSYKRVPGFVKQLQELGIEIVDSLPELVEKSDVLLLESVDGRKHWEQFQVAAVGKPVFIDKPVAASLVDTLAIFRLAEKTDTPCFTTSGLRFCKNVTDVQEEDLVGEIIGVATASPYVIEPTHPSLFWYGIHGVESLYAVMGPGCEEVSRVETESGAVVVGKWSDGRIGTFRGIKQGQRDYLVTVYGSKQVAMRQGFTGYGPLVERMCEFFVSGDPPVPAEETIELVAFMEAADESKRQGGKAVAIAPIIEKAQQELDSQTQ